MIGLFAALIAAVGILLFSGFFSRRFIDLSHHIEKQHHDQRTAQVIEEMRSIDRATYHRIQQVLHHDAVRSRKDLV